MGKSELHEILNALKLHSEHMDDKLDVMKNEIGERIDTVKTQLENQIETVKTQLENRIETVKTQLENRMDVRFDRLEKKIDGIRVDLTETQETVNFLSSKYVQHEKKLQSLMNQHSK